MSKFYFDVDGQKLNVEYEKTVSDTVNYLNAAFHFSDDWDGLSKYAHFHNGTTVYDMILINDCITAERGLNLSAGMWHVNLHGSILENNAIVERITTDSIQIYVEESAVISGEPFPGITPSIGEQIVAQATAQANAASTSASQALASKNAAAGSAQTATTKAGDASTYASQALASKNAAAGSAQTASQKASAANASAIAAAASAASCEPYDDTEIREELQGLNEGIAQLPQDVKVNGTSILDSDNVANIPVISDALGLAKIDSYYGISANTEGRLYVNKATESEIASRSNGFKPITPANLDYGTKSALTTANTSANAWTDSEKANACTRIGAYNPSKAWVLKGTLTTENKDTGVSVDLTGCTEIYAKMLCSTTENVFLHANGNKYLLYFSTRNFSSITKWKDDLFGLTCEFSMQNDNLSFGTMRPFGYVYAVQDTKTSDITKFYFSNASAVTACNIEIYAR